MQFSATGLSRGALCGAIYAGMLGTGLAIAVPAWAGTITDVRLTASSLASGATNVTYTLIYTIGTTLGPNDFLLFAETPVAAISLPIENGNECFAAGVTVRIDGVLQDPAITGLGCSIETAVPARGNLYFRLTSQTVPAGSTVVITIPGGTNTTDLTGRAFPYFETTDGDFSPIDQVSARPNFVQAAVPSLSGWAALGFATLLLGSGLGVLRRRPARWPIR